jgi:ribose transport system permease protein
MAIAVTPVHKPWMNRARLQSVAPLVALVALFLVSAFTSPRDADGYPYFLQLANLLNILRQSSYSGIVALGMTFVIIGGGIDLSVGSMMAFVGVIAVTMLQSPDSGVGAIALAALAAVAAGGLGGLINGLAITKGEIAPFIVTLGTMSIYRSLALWQRDGGQIQSFNPLFEAFGGSGFLRIGTPVWVWVALAALLHVLLNNTRYGRHICAVGSREKVAQYAAIRVNFTRVMSYVIVGAMVGVSAVLWTARLNSMSSAGFGKDVELDAITAVIIGGTPMTGGRGSIWGTVVGAIILGMINNMLNMWGVNVYLQGTVKGLVIIAAALLQKRL